METKRSSTIPLDYIRGLIIAQGGCCAITGVPLDPTRINADHILPLSRGDLSPSDTKENIWLVDKTINAMKGALSYEEFFDLCQKVVNHNGMAKELIERIKSNSINAVAKTDFENWVRENCDENGVISDK